jgi:hypothetical protein
MLGKRRGEGVDVDQFVWWVAARSLRGRYSRDLDEAKAKYMAKGKMIARVLLTVEQKSLEKICHY